MSNAPASNPWEGVFEFDPPDGIRLDQLDRDHFRLESTITYLGETGLENLSLSEADLERLRTVTPNMLPNTDLVSVPKRFRWWINSYGLHTPAALIHDAFIGNPEVLPQGVTEADIDRYFRYMLKAVGAGWATRWLVWAAVVLATRLRASGLRRAFMSVWIVLAATGIPLLIASLVLVYGYEDSRGYWGIYAALLLPIPSAFLWGRQFVAGLIASYLAIPWLIVPTLITLPFIVVIWCINRLFSRIFDDERSVRM